MRKPVSSLFAKILSWFFLNLILVITALVAFFAFQPQVNLHAIFGQQMWSRLQAAGMLIAHDLSQMPLADWSDVLARHAAIHRVDFMIVLQDGPYFSSTEEDLPIKVMDRVRHYLGRKSPRGSFPPPPKLDDTSQLPKNPTIDTDGDSSENGAIGRKAPIPANRSGETPPFMMRTHNPTRYWSGMRVPISFESLPYSRPALLLAVSNSLTGNGFFLDPLPWMILASSVILISVLLWIPMVRHITRPLSRITLATEQIAQGRLDVSIHEPRSDEIGRLARAINHMASRLSDFVKGPKRFLRDVAHELGSPIARIQFGLGALEQRIEEKNRKRVIAVMEDVDHMAKLVNELLAFSRADMKSKTVKLESIDLLPVVQAAVKRETTPAAAIVIRIDPKIRVVASVELLTRAIANLVRNAIRYAADSGPITICAEKEKDHVEIMVQDNGPGVHENLLDQLFEPFFRPELSRDRSSGGVGLGLAIVKTCIETCNGNVSARNRKPSGFIVTITLNQ
jgi:two-component system, OmpR family, sensor histidine kinase CpxA